jgi:gamma-glutamyltranspeptidase
MRSLERRADCTHAVRLVLRRVREADLTRHLDNPTSPEEKKESPAQSRAGLEQKGHELELQGAFSGLVGGGQSVMRDFDAGVNYGASDPRKDGAAIPEPFLP